MFALDALTREKFENVAEGTHGNVLYELMQAEEDAWWATTHRILSARKYIAMYYENFRIANVEVRAMYMQEFSHIHYDTYGDKAVAKMVGGFQAWSRPYVWYHDCGGPN